MSYDRQRHQLYGIRHYTSRYSLATSTLYPPAINMLVLNTNYLNTRVNYNYYVFIVCEKPCRYSRHEQILLNEVHTSEPN